MQFFSASNLFHFFGRDKLWNWLTIIVSSKQEGVEFDSNPGQAAVSWCESECDSLFVSLWPCDKLSTCRGCNPTFPLRRLGEAPATPECRTNNRKWMEGLFFHLLTSNVEFVTICGNIWFIFFHLCISVNDCSRFMGRPKANSRKQGTRQHASQPRGQVLWYLDQEVLHACFIAGCNSNRDRGT